MQTLKQFWRLLKNGELSLHLAANSSILDNKCWDLRKQARQSEAPQKKRHSSYDQNFYRPRSRERHLFSQNWLSREDVVQGVAKEDNHKAVCVQEPVESVHELLGESRFDYIHYRPKKLKDRFYVRTWADFEDMKSFEPLHSLQPSCVATQPKLAHETMSSVKFRKPAEFRKSDDQDKNMVKYECVACNRYSRTHPPLFFRRVTV